MKEFFLRQNQHSKIDFINAINGNQSEILKKELDIFDENGKRVEKYKKINISAIDLYLSNSQVENTDKTKYNRIMKIRKKIHRNKSISNFIDQAPDELKEYLRIYEDELYEVYKGKNKIHDLINDKFIAEKNNLKNNISWEDTILFRNARLMKNLNDGDDISKKQWISLYSFYSQLTFKTVSLNMIGSTGLIKINNEYSLLVAPDNKQVVNIQEYLLKRIYSNILFNNLKEFQYSFRININNVMKEDKVIFKCLLDNRKSSLFENIEVKLSLSKTNKLDRLIDWEEFSYDQLSDIFSDSEIIKYIKTGIIVSSFPAELREISGYFKNLPKQVKHSLDKTADYLTNIQIKFNRYSLENLIQSIFSLCEQTGVDTLGFPVITIDSYLTEIKNKKIIQESIINLYDRQSEWENIKKYYSEIDVLHTVQTKLTQYLKSRTDIVNSGFDKIKLVVTRDVLMDIEKEVFQKINILSLKSGFDLDKSSLIMKDVKEIINSDGNKVTIHHQPSDYSCDYSQISYTAFVQPVKDDTFVLNHLYKGIGTFNRRYRGNYSGFNFKEDYLPLKIYDFPYTFGFNANKRRFTNENTFDDLVKGGDIVLVCDTKSSAVYFENDKGEKCSFSFLGSLSPMGLPRTIALVNAITIGSGFYFDIGDLVAREKSILYPNYDEFYVPGIFWGDNIMLSREKTVIKSEKLLGLFMQDSLVDTLKNINESALFLNDKFMVREFFIDKDKATKSAKPIVISISSVISVLAFEEYLRSAEWVCLESLSPDMQQQPEHVTEYILDV
ncbi:hypothetical protein [Leuconostoc citreum]|uniref:hypothetical protein n=1 Tax=Leuconostoc citreum TaxID=33964 RepID=UPI0032DF04E8